ncbi:MAG: hypothetical protein F4227_07065 [Gammaproteobacteria bacterium]|nr:hypothetical protein [Gammaproteobacteria bacterium]MYF02718.1 hypothetical protein [Gammaproteobacteria bacterium]MYI77219.1 hypothetical protein [Gammaproteobacteria bacterium]
MKSGARHLEPNLSLNHEAVRIDIPPNFDVDTIIDEALEPGTRTYVDDIEWFPTSLAEIIVDDLDDEFEVVYENPPRTTIPAVSFIRDLLGITTEEAWDQGLPIYVPERGILPTKQRWLDFLIPGHSVSIDARMPLCTRAKSIDLLTPNLQLSYLRPGLGSWSITCPSKL